MTRFKPCLMQGLMPFAPAWGLLLCLAAPLALGEPTPCSAMNTQAEALRQLNDLRVRGASCGNSAFAAAPPLRWEERLAQSARGYARELAERDELSPLRHSVLRERFRGAGYRLRLAGENLAAGPEQVDELLALWLASPAHCANLLEPRFVDIGLACVPGRASGEPFWVLHLGRSLQE
ncbi:MAG: CAP domain-containing protein [Burkholderiaceae bacterium]|nr:CAP domain-containing protein [Burkholderiaceae bacterium]